MPMKEPTVEYVTVRLMHEMSTRKEKEKMMMWGEDSGWETWTTIGRVEKSLSLSDVTVM